MFQACPHQPVPYSWFTDNLVGMAIAVKGGPCTGKTTLARALAKSFQCTLASHHDFLSYTSDAERFLSSCPSIGTLPANHFDNVSYEVLWRVAKTQLHGRNHSVVIDSPLRTPAQLQRFQALSTSRAGILPIIIECRAQDKSEWRRRLSKTYSPEEAEMILEDQADDYDTAGGGGDIPKITIDTTSLLGIKEHVTNLEKFILSCLDKKLYGATPSTKLDSGCQDCKMDYVHELTAHLPSTLKHSCHEHDLVLDNFARGYAFDKVFQFHCSGCGSWGRNLHYSCTGESCEFYVHAKCALDLPVTVTPSLQCPHPLVLTSRPLMNPELCYCDYYLCEKERDPKVWFYFCEECEHHYHVRCVDPEFYKSPDLVQYRD